MKGEKKIVSRRDVYACNFRLQERRIASSKRKNARMSSYTHSPPESGLAVLCVHFSFSLLEPTNQGCHYVLSGTHARTTVSAFSRSPPFFLSPSFIVALKPGGLFSAAAAAAACVRLLPPFSSSSTDGKKEEDDLCQQFLQGAPQNAFLLPLEFEGYVGLHRANRLFHYIHNQRKQMQREKN